MRGRPAWSVRRSWGNGRWSESTSSKPAPRWAVVCAGSLSFQGSESWSRITNYPRIQIDKLKNVELITGKTMDCADVLEYGADLVVIATGSSWSTDGLNCATPAPIPGADAEQPICPTPEQILLEGKAVPGRRVLVYDCDGYYVGPSVAERLSAEGHTVDLVTCFEQVAPLCTETLEGPTSRQRLYDLGVRFHRAVRLLRLEDGGAVGEDEFGEPVEVEADAVVLVTQRVSDDVVDSQIVSDPSRLREAGIQAVHTIGDCVAPRLLQMLFDGHRLAREIDSESPALPRPYLREEAAV